MKQHAFIRRIIYVAIVAGLLIPLYLLSSPETTGRDGEGGSEGGVLARMRKKNKLSQTNLGKVDPASGTAKLATFGLRGVATAYLAQKAEDYRRRKLWTEVLATNEQILNLEPHFVGVWENRVWNLSYNVSAECDDYAQRYEWVIKGLRLGKDGCDYNQHSAKLPTYLAFVVSQKIGIADEKVQFRRLFKEDDQFHEDMGTPERDKRDNWLVGRTWYEAAEKLKTDGATIGNMSELLFYSRSPMCLMNYADNYEKDGFFGETAKQNWKEALTQWEAYGERELPTTQRYQDTGKVVMIRLTDFDKIQDRIAKLEERLLAMQPGLRDELRWERWEKLSPEAKGSLRQMLLDTSEEEADSALGYIRSRLDKEQPTWADDLKEGERSLLTESQWAALEKSENLRSAAESDIADRANEQLYQVQGRHMSEVDVDFDTLARSIEGDEAKQAEAKQLALEIRMLHQEARLCDSNRGIVSYPYWRDHARVEQMDEVITARDLRHQARQAYFAANYGGGDDESPDSANALYLAAMQAWSEAMEADEFVRTNERERREILEMVSKYRILLGQLEQLYPEDFPLQDLVREEIRADYAYDSVQTSIAQAEQAVADGDINEAEQAYAAALGEWAELIAGHEHLQRMADREIGMQMLETAKAYAGILRDQGRTIPSDFPLEDFLRIVLGHHALQARSKGPAALLSEDTASARQMFDQAVYYWTEVLEHSPVFAETGMNLVGDPDGLAAEAQQLLDAYEAFLTSQGEELPEDLPLKALILQYAAPSDKASAPAPPAS